MKSKQLRKKLSLKTSHISFNKRFYMRKIIVSHDEMKRGREIKNDKRFVKMCVHGINRNFEIKSSKIVWFCGVWKSTTNTERTISPEGKFNKKISTSPNIWVACWCYFHWRLRLRKKSKARFSTEYLWWFHIRQSCGMLTF